MNNERAFPWCGDLNDCPTINLGLTLRDYFAAKAMQAKISSGSIEPKSIATTAYIYADAMMEKRNAAQ